ncbi:MAG: hypothetical protein WBS20_17520 [Lysobacterales bacterium]
MPNIRLSCLCLLVLVAACGLNQPGLASELNGTATDWTFGGHAKYQYINTTVPANSVLQEISGDSLQDRNLEVRLKLSARHGRWDFNTHAQFINAHADTLLGLRVGPALSYRGQDVINDRRRWFDLTHEIHNMNKNATLIRFDRANLAYSGDKTVIRFGRQAISWGSGLLFTPMDILNPFDPTAIDKEYKSGDDMLYAQYLLDNGNDIQSVAVVRRDPLSGDVEGQQSSLALKYHGFWAGREYDLLATRHYGETVLALGLSGDLGGAVWRGDLVWNDTVTGSVLTGVTGLTWSWVGGGHNWTGLAEYYYNGFGQTGGDYSAAALAANPELLKRLARGELFNIGRHYLGVSVILEATPLLNLTSNAFINLIDPSALAQLVLSYDWKQDVQLLAALSFPIGPDGSEYGGIDFTQPGVYLSTGPALFAQLAWYF